MSWIQASQPPRGPPPLPQNPPPVKTSQNGSGSFLKKTGSGPSLKNTVALKPNSGNPSNNNNNNNNPGPILAKPTKPLLKPNIRQGLQSGLHRQEFTDLNDLPDIGLNTLRKHKKIQDAKKRPLPTTPTPKPQSPRLKEGESPTAVRANKRMTMIWENGKPAFEEVLVDKATEQFDKKAKNHLNLPKLPSKEENAMTLRSLNDIGIPCILDKLIEDSEKKKLDEEEDEKEDNALRVSLITDDLCDYTKDVEEKVENERKRTKTLVQPSYVEYKRKNLITPSTGYLIEDGSNVFASPEQILSLDTPQRYYAHYFSERPHIHFGGKHSTHGPILITLEQNEKGSRPSSLRAFVRTQYSDFWVFVPGNLKEMKRAIIHQLKLTQFPYTSEFFSNLKLREIPPSQQLNSQLVTLEEQLVPFAYKFGVLLCQNGQEGDESKMYSNALQGVVESAPQGENHTWISEKFQGDCEEFLEFLGIKIVLKGWKGYRGGLNVNENVTGTHSIFIKYCGLSIMYHVAPYLPFNDNDPQFLEKKRHLGNDLVLIIFKESDTTPIDPQVFLSHFNKIFFILTKIPKRDDDQTHYRLEIAIKDGKHFISPFIPEGALFKKSEVFLNYLITKLVNCERAVISNHKEFKVPLMGVKSELLDGILKKFSKKR